MLEFLFKKKECAGNFPLAKAMSRDFAWHLSRTSRPYDDSQRLPGPSL